MHFVLATALLLMAPATLGAQTIGAQEKSKAAATRDRVNKVWDEQLARRLRAHVTAQCQEEAKQAYSAIRFNKRREFVEQCTAKGLAVAAAPAPASHQAQ